MELRASTSQSSPTVATLRTAGNDATLNMRSGRVTMAINVLLLAIAISAMTLTYTGLSIPACRVVEETLFVSLDASSGIQKFGMPAT